MVGVTRRQFLKSELVPAEGPILEEILGATFEIWHEGLSRRGYERYYAGQVATAWGRTHLRRWALVTAAGAVLASAKTYSFEAVLGAEPIRIVGLGAVFTQPAYRGRGHARSLIARLLERAAADGADLALLFSEIGSAYYTRLGFTVVPRSEVALRVVESDRRGAPAILVRAGEARDLDDLVAMGRARSAGYRLHLRRDRDLVHFAIAKRRLLAGLGPAGVRQVQFFVAEEGASAVAYVIVSARGSEWIVEEAGDRDPAGARLGAILQVLIARDPAEARPALRGWLPADLCPPQVRVVERGASRDVMMIRPLSERGTPGTPLAEGEVLYWKSDLF
jgi:GNAT superfamily N-acetyltransferase